MECKRRGLVCVLVAKGIPCLGPVTHAGCGSLCPACHRGCYGCFGPKETPNTAALSERFLESLGATRGETFRLFRTFNAWSDPFRKESEVLEE